MITNAISIKKQKQSKNKKKKQKNLKKQKNFEAVWWIGASAHKFKIW